MSPSNEHPGLMSFRMDWLDLLAIQGILKNLLQYHSLEASILQHSTFFIVQLSHPYVTTGKTIALTRQTFVVLCICCIVQQTYIFQDYYNSKGSMSNLPSISYYARCRHSLNNSPTNIVSYFSGRVSCNNIKHSSIMFYHMIQDNMPCATIIIVKLIKSLNHVYVCVCVCVCTER